MNERIQEAYNRGFEDGWESAGGGSGGGGTGGFGLAGLGSGGTTIVIVPNWDTGGASAGRVNVGPYLGSLLKNDDIQGMSAFYFDGAQVRHGNSVSDLFSSSNEDGVIDSDAIEAWGAITLPDDSLVVEQIKRMQAMGITSGIVLEGMIPAQ